MQYYHGSDNGELKQLTLEKSNDGYIYLTPMYSFALLYAACSVRFWNFNKEQGKLVIREMAEDGLKKMYKGKTCYIYTSENLENKNIEEYEFRGRKTIRTKQNVKLISKETITDAYEKIMELYNKGEIIILFYKDKTEEQKQKDIENVKKTVCADMVLNYAKHRKDYDILVKLFPQFALTKQEIIELEKNKE